MVSFNFLNWPMIYEIYHSFLDASAAFGFGAVLRVLHIALSNIHRCFHLNRWNVALAKIHSLGSSTHFCCMLIERNAYGRTWWLNPAKERKKYLILVLWRLIVFRDYRNWTYFASACDALLFSEWWKHWMPLVSIFMDIVRNLTASMRHNLFWWFDCAPFCTLVAHQFGIMRFFVTGYFFDLNEQTNWKLLKISLISVENGL